MVPFTLPEIRPQLRLDESSRLPGSQTLPVLVDVGRPSPGVPVSRPGQAGAHNGCQSIGLGGASPGGLGSGPLVPSRVLGPDQLAGAPGGLSGPQGLSINGDRTSYPGSDGQHHRQGPRQQTGRYQVEGTDVRGLPTWSLGGEIPPIHDGGPHLRCRQRPGRSAQPFPGGSVGMAAPSISVSPTDRALRLPASGPVRDASQHPGASLLLPVPIPGSSGGERPSGPVAPGASLCLPANSGVASSHPQGPLFPGRDHPLSPPLAETTMVRRPPLPIYLSTVADPNYRGSTLPGTADPSGPAVAPSHRLEIERQSLRAQDYDEDVILVMQAARRPSTQRIYASTWKAFCTWCTTEGLDPTCIALPKVLRFLRRGLTLGLSPNTLRRQVAALSSVLSCPQVPSLGLLPDIKQFLRGAANISPPVVHRYPTWDLPRVLQSLTGPPYEPLATVHLRWLSYKVAFLLAITSARRISELSALSVHKDLCVFHADKVVLRLDPAFLPKVNTVFHRSQELVLPAFYARPSGATQRLWHTLDVRRALQIYLDRTVSFRRTEALLVAFLPGVSGRRASASVIGRWIRATIANAYELSSLPTPPGICAHSTRSASTTAAWSSKASLMEICRAATWSSASPFIHHYKVDEFASSDADFGLRVLQHVGDTVL